jgi:hypothetical protein
LLLPPPHPVNVSIVAASKIVSAFIFFICKTTSRFF